MISVSVCYSVVVCLCIMVIGLGDIDPLLTKVLVLALISVNVLCWSVCYVLSAKNGLFDDYNYFLSRALDRDPCRAIACVLFQIMAGLTGLVLFLRSILVFIRLETRIQRSVWSLCNIFSILTILGLIAVPAIPVSLYKTIHRVAACVLFGSAFINMLLLTYLHSSLKLQTVVWIFFVRVGLSVAAFCGLVGFIVFHEESYFVSSICEISAGACMICFLCCFALDSDCFSNHTNTTLSSASIMVSSADVRAF